MQLGTLATFTFKYTLIILTLSVQHFGKYQRNGKMYLNLDYLTFDTVTVKLENTMEELMGKMSHTAGLTQVCTDHSLYVLFIYL